MKKLFAFVAILFALSSNAQPKKTVTEKSFGNLMLGGTVEKSFDLLVNFTNDSTKPKMQIKEKSDTLEITKVGNLKAIKIDNEVLNIEEIKEYSKQLKANKLPLYVTLDWVAVNYQFIKKATNPGLNDEQMDLLKQPLIPWIQYLQKLQQEQQSKKQ